MLQSSDSESFSFEDFEGAIIIISFSLIIGDISIIDVILDCFGSFIVIDFFRWILIVPSIILKIISEGRVVTVIDGFKFPIGIEAEDGTEGVIDEAEDGISVYKLIHIGVGGDIGLILNGG